VAQRQRKGTAPKSSSGGNGMFYGVLAVIAVGGIIAIGYALLGGGNGAAANELVEIEVTDARSLYEAAVPMKLGPDNAPVKIVEFGDFQCPACGQFSLQVRPFIVENYVKTGQVQLTYYDFPLVSIHDNAVLAARAARCAGAQELAVPAALQGVSDGAGTAYWTYHDKLYEEQDSWAYRQGSVVGDFVDYAGEVGLDADAFESCLRSDQFAEVVSANRLLGEQLRLRSTPTVILNNRQVEDWRAPSLGAMIEAALGNTQQPEG
jgi:protein-disulfide isomerase